MGASAGNESDAVAWARDGRTAHPRECDQLRGTPSAPLIGALGYDADRTLRDPRPENRNRAGFMLVAPASWAPRTLRVLGLIAIIAGLSTPWFGVARARAVVDWLVSAGPIWMRLDAVVGMAIGGF